MGGDPPGYHRVGSTSVYEESAIKEESTVSVLAFQFAIMVESADKREFTNAALN
jgi:hypothetical protein